MGFIKWHGEKEDRFEELVRNAKENARLEEERLNRQMKRNADAACFGVPELGSLETDAVLKLVMKEKRALDIWYSGMLKDAKAIRYWGIGTELAEQFYQDFWLYSLDLLFWQADIDEISRCKLMDAMLNSVFKVNNQISVEEYVKRIQSCKEYQQYMNRGFELKSGNCVLFWQWLWYLAELSAKKQEAAQFAKVYFQLLMHLAFYMNQIAPDKEIGKKLAERRKGCAETVRYSLTVRPDYRMLKGEMENPLFEIYAQEEARRQAEISEALRAAEEAAREAARIAAEEEERRQAEAERRLWFIRLVKYAKIIPGYYAADEEDEEDMVTAGQLYACIRARKITMERIVSICPEEAIQIVEDGMLPVFSADEVRFALNFDEKLHYIECAVTYMPDGEGAFRAVQGAVYITDQRVRIEAGKHLHDISFAQMKKAVLYDVMPEIIEIAGAEETVFVRTADTELTYWFLKQVLSMEEEPETESVNMEELTLGYFEKADMETYIFSLRAMSETDIPVQMQSDMQVMVENLDKLDAALKQYPSHCQHTHRFLTYYIPEVLRLVFTFREYQKAGVSDDRMKTVYEKVMASIKKVSDAAVQRVNEIYRLAAMDTVAKADALQKIMKQDGFTAGDKKLKL